MGYEHYWSRPPILDPAAFAAWSRDVRKVVDAFPADVLCGRTWEEGAFISPTLVHFNSNINHNTTPGARNDAGIAFAVPQVLDESFWKWKWIVIGRDPNGWLSDECKTNGKPYDTAVVAALTLLNYHFPESCRIASDGNLADWQVGLELAERVTSLRLFAPIYSHTLNIHDPVPTDAFALWSADVAKIVATIDVPLAGPDCSGEPVITQTGVAFNGLASNGRDPFNLIGERVLNNERFPNHLWSSSWSYWECMTMGNAGKRYDEVVTAALILFAHRFPEKCDLWTKGDMAHWQSGLYLVERATGLHLSVEIDVPNQAVIVE